MRNRRPGPLHSMPIQSGRPGPLSHVALLNRLRAEIATPSQLRYVRLLKGGDTLPGYEPSPHLKRGWAARHQEVRRAGCMNSKRGAALGAVHPLRYVRVFWWRFQSDRQMVGLKIAILVILVVLATAV